MEYSSIENNSIDYKELTLSAVRAKLSYLSYDQIKDYWNNYTTILSSDNIIHYIFENISECPRYYCNINETAVAPASAASFIVIRPADLFNVTPVDLLVACVTVPWAAAEYPIS